MNKKPLQLLNSSLLFLLDALHAIVLAASASILFHCVLEYPFTSKKIILIAAIAVPAILLFLRNKIFRIVSLLALGAGALATITLMILSSFYPGVRSIWNELMDKLITWVTRNETPPFLIVLLASMLSAIIVTHGKRLVYLFVLAPPLAIIILSMFSAEFPVAPLVVYTVAAIALVLRKKYDWFERLLSPWPSTKEMLNAQARPDQDKTSAVLSGVNSSPPSRKGLGYPNIIVRSLLLIVTAAIIALLFRPIPTPGPLFGEETSRSIELKFQTLLDSSSFFQDLFGIKPQRIGPGKRTTGTYGKLGGPADLGNDPILYVKCDSPGVYLRGFTYNDYLGNSWNLETDDYDHMASLPEVSASSVVTNKLEERIVRYNPAWLINYTYYSVSQSEGFWNRHKKQVAAQYIAPYDARFGVFIPSGSRTLRFFDEDINFYIQYPDLHLQLTKTGGIRYTSKTAPAWVAYEASYLTYDDSMILSSKLYDLCGRGYYSNLASTLSSVYGGYPYSYSDDIQELNELVAFSNYIYDRYTRLSGYVSQEVINLAHQITDGLAQQDDWHKAIAIKNYLLSGKYKYNLSPAEIPEGVDILDQFLFKEKEGYCTYFATAMTVLARAAGVPARYVEGFYVNPGAKTEDGLYMLTEQNLHAWCEIYIEGLGFVTMEATAGFGSISAPATTATPVPTATPAPTETPEPGTEEPTREPTETPENTGHATPTAELTPAPTEDPIRTEPKKLPAAIKILIIVLIIVILIAAILYLLYRLSSRRPGRKGNGAQRTVAVYRSCEALLKKFGYRKDPAATPREFSDSLTFKGNGTKNELPADALDAFGQLTGIYEATVYSPANTGIAEYKKALACRDKMINALKDRFGKIKTQLRLIGTVRK